MRAPVHRDGELIGLGRFSFSYALLPHRGDWREAALPQHGYAFNHGLAPVFTSTHPGSALAGRSLYRVEDTGVLITAAKYAQDGSGVVLRLYESHGRRTTTRLSSLGKVVDAVECDLTEMPLPREGRCRQVSDHEIEVTLRPFEIKTLLLEQERIEHAERLQDSQD
jgi:alpha-mannosidase